MAYQEGSSDYSPPEMAQTPTMNGYVNIARPLTDRLRALQSLEERRLFELVDRLKDLDVHKQLDLPQLVVCGSQSSGKSSVLEAISALQFPRGEFTCTKFVTELRFCPGDTETIKIDIDPDSRRSAEEQDRLRNEKFRSKKLSELGIMVKEAEKKLGLTGRSGFARDKLRVVVTRPDQQPLTLVDTPGLISSHNDGREYIDLVKDIVDGCIKKERTLILAVVEASLDPQKQSILTTAKEVDPKGERTFGIITKPDVVEPGSQLEGYWIEKVSNAPGRISEFNFEKGWHVLRNRGVRETGNETSTAERDEAEKRFFTDTSRRWHQIDEKHWGIDSLQTRLRSIYYQHTKKQLPEIEKGILSKLHAAETERDEINTKLEDPAVVWDVYCEERAELATRAKDCVEGIFHDDSSADWSDAYYLRSRIEEEHDEFTQDMEHNGHGLRLPGSDRSLTEDKEAYQAYCQLMLKQTRGRELKESYDPNRLNLLFRLHSKPWNGIARRHLNNAHDRCVAFINRIIDTVLREQLPSLPIRVSETMKDHLKKELVIKRKEAEAELAALELDRRQPAQTQSSGFERRARQLKMGKNYAMLNRIEEENAQQRRAGRTSTTREQNREAENETPTSETPGGPIPLPVNDTWFTPARVGEILAQDSRAEAAAEIGERMIEYYKIAREVFVDNVVIQVIERNLLRPLHKLFRGDIGVDKELFIHAMDAERDQNLVHRRDRLNERISELRACRDELRRG